MSETWNVSRLDGTESGDLRLCLATEDDLPRIVEMMLDPSTLAGLGETAEHAKETLRRTWAEDPETSGLRHFVVERASHGDVIAYLRLEYPFNEPGCLWLTFFLVAPGRRGQGHGRRIMDMLRAAARESGCVRTFGMHTFAANAAAVALYESAGFKCVKREPWRGADGGTSNRLTFCSAIKDASA